MNLFYYFFLIYNLTHILILILSQARCGGRILHLSSYVEGILCQKPRHLDQILQRIDEDEEEKNEIIEEEEKRRKENTRNEDEILDEGNEIINENKEISKKGFRSLFRWASKYDSDCIGEIIEKTINLHTTAGFALLIHPNKEIVDRDYHRLIELQKDMYEV